MHVLPAFSQPLEQPRIDDLKSLCVFAQQLPAATAGLVRVEVPGQPEPRHIPRDVVTGEVRPHVQLPGNTGEGKSLPLFAGYAGEHAVREARGSLAVVSRNETDAQGRQAEMQRGHDVPRLMSSDDLMAKSPRQHPRILPPALRARERAGGTLTVHRPSG